MTGKCSEIRKYFERGDFNLATIASATGASENTVKTQMYKWKKETKTKDVENINKFEHKTPEQIAEVVEQLAKEEKPLDTTITKAEFLRYERVRRAGVTNMLDVNVVKMHSNLSTEKIKQIIKEYSNLRKVYPEVRL